MNRISDWQKVSEWLHVGEPVPRWAHWSIFAIAVVVFVCGLLWQHAGLLGVGAIVLCLHLRLCWPEKPKHHHHHTRSEQRNRQVLAVDPDERAQPLPERWRAHPEFADLPETADALVNEMLVTGRYALLLRPEMNRHLDREHIVRAVRHLDEAMGLVPAGRVLLGPLAEQASSSSGAVDADPKSLERYMQRVETLYLDRYPVTNFEFQEFVNTGGYEKLEYWDEEALPALLDFVDQSGQPGPRYWCDGHYAAGEERHPVVGVSWYEASAFARWVGKRLPTDAEWTKAGAWPVESAPGRIAQRRYPWGESFDIRRANLWGSNRKETVDVDEYPDGESVGGVHQLVGNVWEWTGTSLAATAEPSFHVPETFKSIRGGAFDTYFENQATCHYQSGDHPLARRHNVGFRLALPMAMLEVASDEDTNEEFDHLVDDYEMHEEVETPAVAVPV